MALIDDIRREAAGNARLLDRIDAAFAEDLDRVLRQLNRRIRRLVGRLEAADGRLVASRSALGLALRLREEIITALTASGWRELSDLTDDLTAVAERALRGRSFVARAARQVPIDTDVLLALQELPRASFLALGTDAADALWRAILDGTIGARSVSDLVDELAEVTAVTQRQARTIHDTATSVYSRQVRQLGIEDPGPEDRFVYLGPLDTETRPFCRGLVGEVRTRAEIDALENGQLANTLLTAGGYNCRHIWQFIGTLSLSDLAA
jgi:hypothetical protein